MRIRIEKVHGDSLEVLHVKDMSVYEAMDLASEATLALDADDYFTVVRIIPPIPDTVFSFGRTESTIQISLNGKPYAEKEFASG